MTRPDDDDDLIDRLRSGIAERQADFTLPAGIADGARHAARRRRARRAAALGVPVLVAAGVIAALGTVRSGRSAASVETAYIVRQVRTRVTADTDVIFQDLSYSRGRVTSDGSIVGVGGSSGGGFDYIAPDGTDYQRHWTTDARGHQVLIGIGRTSPAVDGRETISLTMVDVPRRTYDPTTYTLPEPAGASNPRSVSDAVDAAAQVRRELRSGRVTRLGTTTVDGMRAIALSLHKTGYDMDLYVDARTYRPLETVMTNPDHDPTFAGGVNVTRWEPATSANIAVAEDSSIPAGYHRGFVHP